MLKYIGISLIALGIALFIFAILTGRRKGIRSDIKELSMIESSGYVAEREAEEKKPSPFEGKIPLKPASKKKRVLSEEARGILEMVEKDRGGNISVNSTPPKKEIHEEASPRKETAPLPNKKGTAVLAGQAPRKGTAVLESQAPSNKGTAVLQDAAAPKKGTATLPESIKPEALRKGTAVLQEEAPARKGTAVLNVAASNKEKDEEVKTNRKGTAVLGEKGGTQNG